MSCCISINNITIDISEAELVGIFCHIIDIFGDQLTNPLFNVEVSFIKDGVLLPKFPEKSWTLYQKLCAIKIFCDSLKFLREGDQKGELSVMPIGINKSMQKYYLHECDFEGFIIGYDNLLSILRINSEIHYPENYRDHFVPDINLISQCKLVTTNRENRNFVMKIPCYLWDLPIYEIKYNEQITVDLINLFLRDCTDYDHQLLFNNNYYLRILIYQDKPDADRYCYGYLRKISDCTFDSHKNALKSISKDRLPCEIVFAKRGYFYHFPILEWNHKYVDHIVAID